MKLSKDQLREIIKKTIKEIKNTNPSIEGEKLVEAVAAVASRLLPALARHAATDVAIDKVAGDDKEEQEEGKAAALKKVGKKVWKKVGPHVKDVAKQAAVAGIEKGAEVVKDKVTKKLDKKKDKNPEENIQSNIQKRRYTVKEVRQWMKKLEENRYKKVYNSDARRVAWMVNNEGVSLDEMPISMKKKWTKAQYGREKFLANEFINSNSEQKNINK